MSDSENADQPQSIESSLAFHGVARPVEPALTKKTIVTQLWWLTLLCLVLAILLFGWSWWNRGIQIHVQFLDGHGLKAENRLMHRGIEVGVIERVRLAKELGNVEVTIRLNDSAGALACEGSRFWIERPMASIQGVRSLETILSGRYIAVEPGPVPSLRQFQFQGLDQPPQPSIPPGSLEIILEANDRHGLQVNAPVIYRGLEVGRIQSVGLSADSRWVQIRAMILEDYRALVRENSRFWNRSGVRIDVGLTGVEIDAESLSTIAIGGIEFATPDPPSAAVKTGRRFELASQADPTWALWRPRLLYGTVLPKEIDIVLSPLRLSQHWQASLFGFRKNESRAGWILLLDDGTAIGPIDLFKASSKAIDDTTRWEAAGVEFTPEQLTRVDVDATGTSTLAIGDSARVARYRIDGFSSETPRWPVDRLSERIDNTILPNRLWIACDVPSRWIPIEPHQLAPAIEDGWLIDASLGISAEQHGAPVFDSELGKVIGLMIVQQRTATIRSCR